MTHIEPAAREEQLQRENTTLRAIVAKIMPCHYCGVDDIAKCAAGFPGCDLADDISAYDSLVWTEYRALKRRITSEPAGPISVVPAEVFAMCADILNGYDSPTIRETALATVLHGLFTKPREPEPTASVPVTDETIEDALHPILRPHFSTPLLGPILDECSKAILALLAASTGARGAVVEEQNPHRSHAEWTSLLNGRDDFIISHGLWAEFTEGLKP